MNEEFKFTSINDRKKANYCHWWRWISMEMTTLIRRASSCDVEGIHKAHMRSIEEVCSKDYNETEIKAWGHRCLNREQRENAIKNDCVWIVEEFGIIEGYGHLRLFEKDNVKQGYICGLYLTPKVLGKNFGHRILSLMIDQAKKFEAKKISLESTISAHAFYEKNGFRDRGPMTAIQINDQQIQCYPMLLDLNLIKK